VVFEPGGFIIDDVPAMPIWAKDGIGRLPGVGTGLFSKQ